ncbi:MAG: DUF929 domain-containing protein [Candidatus Marsarchaeota archaeon]|nr:DUF929 domain-containing protein [Candidatus Marsarchaeota archaeon]MCL5102183.1 DUF929 domain-containing protein [Candidatus Marsarchaeota archaeon]
MPKTKQSANKSSMHSGSASNAKIKNLIKQKNYYKASTIILLILLIAVVFASINPFKPAKLDFGSRLTNIDAPFSAQWLSVINNAPNSDFNTAALKLLNGTLTDEIIDSPPTAMASKPFIVGGKPSVIYVGAISCVFCGENRWAMALALSRFGNFSNLYEGYSSFGDHDVPTIYWSNDNYTTKESVGFGNYYHSNYINFISADYESPIVDGFEVQPISYFVSQAPNATYASAMSFMNSTNDFEGTPFSLWGNVIAQGATGIVFGNTTPSTATLPLTNETHAQVISQLKNFNDQFAWGEYAAADVYIAYLCPTLNNTPSVCQLQGIKDLEKQMGL